MSAFRVALQTPAAVPWAGAGRRLGILCRAGTNSPPSAREMMYRAMAEAEGQTLTSKNRDPLFTPKVRVLTSFRDPEA